LRYGAEASVRIGNFPCNVTDSSSTLIKCTLSAGEGAELPLFVNNQDKFGDLSYSLSYENPIISSITGGGCSTIGDSVTNCSRVNGTTVTIKGTNFGRGLPPNSPAKVLIAGEECGDVVHAGDGKEHEELTCKLQGAPASSRVQSVVLIPGALSKSLSKKMDLSYRPCDLGWQRKESNWEVCEKCPIGKFRGKQELDVCEACEGRTNGNRTACVGCPPSSTSNATHCRCNERFYFVDPAFFQGTAGYTMTAQETSTLSTCQECPANMQCESTGMTIFTLKPKNGCERAAKEGRRGFGAGDEDDGDGGCLVVMSCLVL
jgi:hypothetical protein